MPDSSATHVPALPAMGVFTLLRALFKRPQSPLPAALPEILTEYRIDQLPLDGIARYRAAFGFAGERIPLTWWYLLAQRAHLATMLRPAFPFRIVGLVHMENALEEHGAIAPDQALVLRTVLRVLPPSSSGAIRCTLETTGKADSGPVFTCTSTYLIRRAAGSEARRADKNQAPAGEVLARWALDPAAGRRYARLSGDWNPIHLYDWSARLMGMRAPIIHGMHTLATSCSALELAAGLHLERIDCRFLAPVPLGSTASLHTVPGTGAYTVEAGAKTAVTGDYTLARF